MQGSVSDWVWRLGLCAAATLGVLAAAEPARAQSGSVYGRVTAGGSPLGAARVEVVGSELGVLTDGDGRYRLVGVVPGRQRLRASALGHAPAEGVVEVEGGAGVRRDFALEVEAVALESVVVTGTMKRTTVSESTVKVEVVPAAVLQRAATSNLMESIQFVNGLYQQVDCGVCYTNNIRINGMEGPYTAVLIDGMPIMSALASVYGLNGINPAVIERVEILKGPASTLYGTEAMGGVVNVITRSPRFAPRLVVDAYRTSLGEGSLDFAAAGTRGGVDAMVSGSLSELRTFHDDNGDGFSDAPLFRRAALFGKADARRGERRVLGLTGKYYYEDRFGGVEGWTEADRGSGTVYGESIYTHRLELLGSYLLPGGGDGARLDFSATHHDQDSYYGDTRYAARQSILFANLLRELRPGRAHDALLGVTARWQRYDDDTPATAGADRRLIPGVFAQDEWRAAPGLTLLGGLRLDHHQEHGVIASPRASLKWEPWHDGTVRVNSGTGFRVVNLFTEDHAALTGSRRVVIAESLEPERSWSFALNLNQVLELGPNPMMIDVDAFWTRFSNKIVPDYGRDPDVILYENLRGHSVSRGVSVSLNQNVGYERLLYTAGATLQDVYAVEGGERSRELFAPRYTATWGLTYNHPAPVLTLDYAGRLTGPMRLPEYPAPHARPTTSPAYSIHELRATLAVGGGVEVYGAVNNLLDYAQGSPLVDPANPFGDAFDTAYVYGPVQGRELVLGARVGVSR